jgi:GINS complex subunit 2
MAAEHNEFLAEDVPITIVPNFEHSVLHFIAGDFGPFDPLTPVEVPLWLAIALKKRHKCQIEQPDWMDQEYLGRKLESEKEEGTLVEMPYHYMETASLLFNNALDDIRDAERIRTTLEDIENRRQAKLLSGLKSIGGAVSDGDPPTSANLSNVGAMELTSIRPFMVQAFDDFYFLTKKAGAAGAAGPAVGQQNQVDDDGDAGAGGGRPLRRFR